MNTMNNINNINNINNLNSTTFNSTLDLLNQQQLNAQYLVSMIQSQDDQNTSIDVNYYDMIYQQQLMYNQLLQQVLYQQAIVPKEIVPVSSVCSVSSSSVYSVSPSPLSTAVESPEALMGDSSDSYSDGSNAQSFLLCAPEYKPTNDVNDKQVNDENVNGEKAKTKLSADCNEFIPSVCTSMPALGTLSNEQRLSTVFESAEDEEQEEEEQQQQES